MTQPANTPPANDPGNQGDPTNNPGNQPTPGNQQPAPGNTQPSNDPPQNDPNAGKKDDGSVARIAALEKQLAESNTQGQQWKNILDKLGAVLNPDKAPKPEELQASLAKRDEELKQKTLELAVVTVAGSQAGGTLLDSRKFLDSIKGMDPNSEEFKTKVTEAVSRLSPTQTAAPGTPTNGGGADLTGGKGGSDEGKITDKSQLEGMAPSKIMELYRAGKLNDLEGIKKK